MAEKLGHGALNGTAIELPREDLDSLMRVLLSRLSYALQRMGFGKHAPQNSLFTPPPRLMQNAAIYDSYIKYLTPHRDQNSPSSNHASRSSRSESIPPNLRTLSRRAILRRSADAPMDHGDIEPTYELDPPVLRHLALAAILLAAICLTCLIVWFFIRRSQHNKRVRKMREEHGEPKEVHMVDHEAEHYVPPPGPPWSAAPDARFHNVRL